jgi:archaellum biogenesis protein FlaJ (TadC family)
VFTVCGIMYPRCCRPVAWKLRFQATGYSVPEGGRNHRPKHVELIGIINKQLMFVSSWLSILFVSMMHGQTNIKYNYVFCLIWVCNLASYSKGRIYFESL